MTEHEKLVEKVARGIYESHPAYQGAHPENRIEWDEARYGVSGVECYRQARAALSVIREAVKNPPQSREGQDAIWFAAQLQNANDCYRAIIAASPIGEK